MEDKDDKGFRVPIFDNRETPSFHIWNLRAEAILGTKNRLNIVDGTEKRLADGVENAVQLQTNCDRRKRKTAAFILACIGEEVIRTVQKCSKTP